LPVCYAWTNGPELTAADFSDWCGERAIQIGYIQPGKPDQNAYIERLRRSFRGDVLDAYVFGSIADVRAVTEKWLEDYKPGPAPRQPRQGATAQFLTESRTGREYTFDG
jgi:putative transposase